MDLSQILEHGLFAYELQCSGVISALLAFLNPSGAQMTKTPCSKRKREAGETTLSDWVLEDSWDKLYKGNARTSWENHGTANGCAAEDTSDTNTLGFSSLHERWRQLRVALKLEPVEAGLGCLSVGGIGRVPSESHVGIHGSHVGIENLKQLLQIVFR